MTPFLLTVLPPAAYLVLFWTGLVGIDHDGTPPRLSRIEDGWRAAFGESPVSFVGYAAFVVNFTIILPALSLAYLGHVFSLLIA